MKSSLRLFSGGWWWSCCRTSRDESVSETEGELTLSRKEPVTTATTLRSKLADQYLLEGTRGTNRWRENKTFMRSRFVLLHKTQSELLLYIMSVCRKHTNSQHVVTYLQGTRPEKVSVEPKLDLNTDV